MAHIQPLGKRVLVKRTQPAASQGKILLPDTAKEKPKEGEVIAVGAGKRDEQGNLDPVTVKVGDRVLFSSYGGTEVKIPGQEDAEFLILTEDDLFGVYTSACCACTH